MDPVLENRIHTFVVPLYNGAKFIRGCLENIFSCQYHPFEVVVVDDGSTDDSAQIVAQSFPNVTLVQQENQGPAAARNAGLAAAEGTFLSFLDQDDLYPPGRTARLMTYMLEDPELSIVGGKTKFINLEGADNRIDIIELDEPEENRSQTVNIGSMLFRRRAFDQIGLFQSKSFSDDVDFFIRIRESKAKVLLTNMTTLHYHVHDSNMTKDILHDRSARRPFFDAIRRSMERRRLDPNISIRKTEDLKDKP